MENMISLAKEVFIQMQQILRNFQETKAYCRKAKGSSFCFTDAQIFVIIHDAFSDTYGFDTSGSRFTEADCVTAPMQRYQAMTSRRHANCSANVKLVYLLRRISYDV